MTKKFSWKHPEEYFLSGRMKILNKECIVIGEKSDSTEAENEAP